MARQKVRKKGGGRSVPRAPVGPSLPNTEFSREPYTNSESNTLICKLIEELGSNSDLMQVHFIGCAGQFS
jgi:hypothetical protein